MLVIHLNGSTRVCPEAKLTATLEAMGLPCAKAYALDILGDLRQGYTVDYPTQLGGLKVMAA